MQDPQEPSSLLSNYHRALPARIRAYLNGRGIPNAVIDLHRLSWNGERITIPIFDRAGRFSFFKLAKDPDDGRTGPKMLTPAGASAELYGWERLCVKPPRIVICEGEFDRLVLEAQGIAAVTSTGGAGVFRREWAEAFADIPDVYLCFDRDGAGRNGALHVARMIPHARLVHLPDDVGEGGDVTDFFVRLGRTRDEFLMLLEAAKPAPAEESAASRTLAALYRPRNPELLERTEAIKRKVAIGDVIGQCVDLCRSGRALRGLCPFHEDHEPSLMVSPEKGLFRCFGCGKRGDVIKFLQEVEHLSFSKALDALEHFVQDHDREGA